MRTCSELPFNGNIKSSDDDDDDDDDGTDIKEQRGEKVQWGRAYGERHVMDRNLRRDCSYVHMCRGHNGTVTCLALATAKQGRTRIFSGDGLVQHSILY